MSFGNSVTQGGIGILLLGCRLKSIHDSQMYYLNINQLVLSSGFLFLTVQLYSNVCSEIRSIFLMELAPKKCKHETSEIKLVRFKYTFCCIVVFVIYLFVFLQGAPGGAEPILNSQQIYIVGWTEI